MLLSTKNLRQPGPSVRELRPLYLGPFEVDSMVGNVAVKLNLPREWTRIHNVFHVDLVEHTCKGQVISLAGSVLSHQLHCSFWMVSLCLR